tara:strand:+ start:2163 stop:2522 length:360 start_codon:yes stop_codon:yes gene_type:complete
MARRTQMGRPRAISGRGVAGKPWLGTHGWRTAPTVVKDTIDEAMMELEMGRPRTVSGSGAAGRPWLATHGWRTAPPVVKNEVNQAMMSMASESKGQGSGNESTDFPQRLRGRYGDGFPG